MRTTKVTDSEQQKMTREDFTAPPRGYFVLTMPSSSESRADISQIARILLDCWRPLLAAAIVCGVIGAVVSLQMRNVYRSKVLVVPVTQMSGVGGFRNQLGGLAALAGIDLGGSGERKDEYIATLTSDGFAREFIVAEGLLPTLTAERQGIFGNLLRGGHAPTLADAVDVFTSDVTDISVDRKTGLVTLSVDWFEPALAAQWANRMIDRVNQKLREEAVRDSARSIEYLNRELQKTDVVELRKAIFEVIENQVNNAMLANVQSEYAFKVIDQAVPSDKKHKVAPRRSVITIACALGGILLASGFVLWRRRADWLV